MREAFNNFDADNSGELDFAEFKRILTTIGNQPFTDEELSQLMLAMDDDGNGSVDVEEFIWWLFHNDDGSPAQLEEEPSTWSSWFG